jgi:hypothetical protein
MRALAWSPHLAGLRELSLRYNQVTRGVTLALGQARFWPGLRKLALDDASITDPVLDALPDAPALVSFSLWKAAVTPDGIAALAQKAMPHLEQLELGRLRSLGDAGLARLLAAPGLPALRELTLHEIGLTAAGVAALAGSPRLARLTALQLCDEQIGPDGARALAASPYAAGLRQLFIHGCAIGADGARALAASPHLTRLRGLLLDRSDRESADTGPLLRERFGDRLLS